MLKLFATFAMLGALSAGVFLVSVRGRTIADRWTAASDPAAFAKDAWNEGRAALSGEERGIAPGSAEQPYARRGRAAQQGPRHPARSAVVPAEHHTAEDRAALERLLTERSR